MIFGLEKIFTSSICSNALMARRKSSTESCPEKPRALRQAISKSLRLNDDDDVPLPTPVGEMTSIVLLNEEDEVEVAPPVDPDEPDVLLLLDSVMLLTRVP